MARFKRTFRRVRRPLRKRRIFRRRYKRVSRRFNSGSMWCKFTKVATVEVPNDTTSVWEGSFVPDDFPEYTQLAPNFEAIQFYKQRIRVMPLQNVSNNSTSQLPAYTMLPWHKPGPLQKNFNTYLSVDKAKMFKQTQSGRQTYVCAVLQTSLSKVDSGGNETASNFVTLKWRPRIERGWAAQSKFPRIYTGIIAFQGEQTMTGRKSAFNIVMDVWVKCINQSVFVPGQ